MKLFKQLSVVILCLAGIFSLSCKSSFIGGGAVSGASWNLKRAEPGQEIILSVRAKKSVRYVTFTVWEVGVGGQKDRKVLTDKRINVGGKAEMEWRYSCPRNRNLCPKTIPRYYFTAASDNPPYTTKSGEIIIAEKINMKMVSGFGGFGISDGIYFVLEARDGSGRVIHRLKGVTNEKGKIPDVKLIPCGDYRVFLVMNENEYKGREREWKNFTEEWGDNLVEWQKLRWANLPKVEKKERAAYSGKRDVRSGKIKVYMLNRGDTVRMKLETSGILRKDWDRVQARKKREALRRSRNKIDPECEKPEVQKTVLEEVTFKLQVNPDSYSHLQSMGCKELGKKYMNPPCYNWRTIFAYIDGRWVMVDTYK